MQREKNLLFIIIALIFALLAAAGTYYYLKEYEKKLLAESNMMVPVVATTTEIKAGTEIKPFMVTTMPWPKRKILPTHIKTKEAVIGKVSTINIPKNFPILQTMITNKKSDISNIIPEKMRAMTLQLEANSADVAFIKPGVYVDILATFSPPGIPPYTKTILKGVKIIAVNGLTEALYSSINVKEIEEITVLIKAKDVEKVASAKTEAKIQVVLRNQNEIETEEEDMAKQANIKAIQKKVKQFVPNIKEYSSPVTLIRGTEVKKVHLK